MLMTLAFSRVSLSPSIRMGLHFQKPPLWRDSVFDENDERNLRWQHHSFKRKVSHTIMGVPLPLTCQSVLCSFESTL